MDVNSFGDLRRRYIGMNFKFRTSVERFHILNLALLNKQVPLD